MAVRGLLGKGPLRLRRELVVGGKGEFDVRERVRGGDDGAVEGEEDGEVPRVDAAFGGIDVELVPCLSVKSTRTLTVRPYLLIVYDPPDVAILSRNRIDFV